ncbi:hypothetical protein [Streptomyces sp. NPDC056144]|uniref:hypothetical protein n=1 Tax=unclassified Streptomyces TaxID=2593676 RepID=UPI0035E0C1BE
MSATPAGPTPRVGRNYTQARTLPWVLGKLGDFVLWFGPYNAGQLIIAAVGVLVLIKTFSWWSGLGPLPVLALGVLVWAARAQRIGGRAPLWVLYGLARRVSQPKTGRIGGRTARAPRTRRLAGTVLIEHSSATHGSPTRAPAPERVSVPVPARAGAGPAPTPLQQMLSDRSTAKATPR